MKIITVNKNDEGQRVDKFLTKFLPEMPKSLLYKQLRKKRVKRNKKALAAQDILQAGDELYLYINDEFFGKKTEIASAEQQFSVVFEDENIMVVDKPAGVSAHDGENSLLKQLQWYLYQKGEYSPEKEQSFTPALSNRLDRNTRGLVLMAKNAAAQKMLNEKIKEGQVSKEYLCLVKGTPKAKKGRLEHFLKSSEKENKVFVVSKDDAHGKQAILEYEVLKTGESESFVHVTLLTGRKHQIRVQFSAIGHPLVGDRKYGGSADSRYQYQALWAYQISFRFASDAGVLNYLNGKQFSIKEKLLSYSEEL